MTPTQPQPPPPSLPLLLLLLLLAAAASAVPDAVDAVDANGLDDGCDWSGSGLSGPERGVSPVYLRCSQGRIDWSYPRGALRVLLRLGVSGGDFRGCVRLGGGAGGARLFLEGARSLAPLFEPEEDWEEEEEATAAAEGGGGEPRCFRSRAAQAVLYIEAERDAPLSRRALSLFYRLRPAAAPAALDHDDDECRPCTAEEMLHLFCTCDFAARGAIEAVRTRPGSAVSEVHVVASAVLRQLQPVFQDATPDAQEGEGRRWRAALRLPARCGAAHGPGEFLFLGRVELGQPALVCAPQLHHWAMVRARALEAGDTQCRLDT